MKSVTLGAKMFEKLNRTVSQSLCHLVNVTLVSINSTISRE